MYKANIDKHSPNKHKNSVIFLVIFEDLGRGVWMWVLDVEGAIFVLKKYNLVDRLFVFRIDQHLLQEHM